MTDDRGQITEPGKITNSKNQLFKFQNTSIKSQIILKSQFPNDQNRFEVSNFSHFDFSRMFAIVFGNVLTKSLTALENC
jgi:hypothetical protein